MAEDKTRKPEQLNDEQLDEVSGGGQTEVMPKSEEKDR